MSLNYQLPVTSDVSVLEHITTPPTPVKRHRDCLEGGVPCLSRCLGPEEPPCYTPGMHAPPCDDSVMRTASGGCLLYGAESVASEDVRVTTWNVAAVNLNPFEYWVQHPDPAYNQLMEGVQDFIDNPGARDVEVGTVLGDRMAQQLFEDLRQARVEHVDKVEAIWATDLRSRRIVSGVLKDTLLGKKRLISMPDRITNTIRTRDGAEVAPQPPTRAHTVLSACAPQSRRCMRGRCHHSLPGVGLPSFKSLCLPALPLFPSLAAAPILPADKVLT